MTVQQTVNPLPDQGTISVNVQPPPPQGMWSELFRYRDNRLGFMLIVPSLLTLVLIQFYPIVYNIWLILTSEKGEFIGLTNLSRLTRDTIFHGALIFSLKMAIVVVPMCLLVGLGLALLVRSDYAGRKTLWNLHPYYSTHGLRNRRRYDVEDHVPPTLGLVNFPLTLLGFEPIIWLVKADTAFIALCVVEVWRISPLAFLLLYAGLSQVPRDIYGGRRRRWRNPLARLLGHDPPLYQANVRHRHHPRLCLVHPHHRHHCRDHPRRPGPGYLEPVLVHLRHVVSEAQAPLASAAVLVMLLMTYIAGTLFVRYLWVERRSR